MFQMDFTVRMHGDSGDQKHQKWERTGHLVVAVGHLILILGYSSFSYALDFQIRASVCIQSCFLLSRVLQLRAGCPCSCWQQCLQEPALVCLSTPILSQKVLGHVGRVR